MLNSILEEFIEFAKQEYGQNIFLDVNVGADTFEKIFVDEADSVKDEMKMSELSNENWI